MVPILFFYLNRVFRWYIEWQNARLLPAHRQPPRLVLFIYIVLLIRIFRKLSHCTHPCCGSKYIEFGSGSRLFGPIWIRIQGCVIHFEKKTILEKKLQIRNGVTVKKNTTMIYFQPNYLGRRALTVTNIYTNSSLLLL